MKVTRKTCTPNLVKESKNNNDIFKVKIEISENKKEDNSLKNSITQ
jgi:hypothetical protein